MNRWKLGGNGRRDGQFGFTLSGDHRDGGQAGYWGPGHEGAEGLYGFHLRTRRAEAFAKAGTLIGSGEDRSAGLIISAFRHEQDMFWGARDYRGRESSLYANGILQFLGDSRDLSLGASWRVDACDETLDGAGGPETENVPGVFAESVSRFGRTVTLQAGLRADRHSRHGALLTPRAHLRFQFSPVHTLRLSAGRGFRRPHVFAENIAVLASSRRIEVVEPPGLERAWNAGLDWTRDFVAWGRLPVSASLDAYRTEFQNQAVVDAETRPGVIRIHDLHGRAYSNSVQGEAAVTWFRGFETSAAVRFNDARTTLNGRLVEVPLQSRWRGLFTASWKPAETGWQADLTVQWNGPSRLPDTREYPEEYRSGTASPPFVQVFGQVKRKWRFWELYAGVENLTDFRQTDPILAWQDPFGPWFDSSRVWGPTVGRRLYAGIRVN
jgi:outer membrane receptor protein involved in Fe transport